MKFQLMVFIFCIITSSLTGQSLTPDENNKRLDNCGNFPAGFHFSNIFSWTDKIENGTDYTKTAAFISSRHILMSSRVVLLEKKWRHNGQTVDMDNCTNKENGYIHVPNDLLGTIGFGWEKSFTRAIIICNKETFAYVEKSWMSFPMIVEITKNHKFPTFCLPSEDYQLRMNEDHLFWQYINGGIYNSTLKIRSKNHKGFFKADPYTIETDGLLVDKIHQHQTLVGLGANPVEGRFHKLQLYSKDFCDLFGICKVYAGKLSVKENEKRLKDCGTGISFDVFGYVTNGKAYSMTTMISSRHVLTTADILLERNQSIVNRNDCEPSIRSVQVPLEAFSGLEFSWKEKAEIKHASIICDFQLFRTHPERGLPMIIEVSPNFPGYKPCLPDQGTLLNEKHPLRLYQFSQSGNYLFTGVKFKSNYEKGRYIEVDKEYEEKTSQSGNPLFETIELGRGRAKWTIFGVSTKKQSIFFSVQWILQKICDLTGICQKSAPTIVAPSTEAPTTEPSAPPAIEGPTTESQSAQASTTIKADEPTTAESQASPEPADATTLSTIEPSTPQESTALEPMEPIKTIDLDEEYKEFKEREDNEEEDWDEWGNDFYRSADFFESSGRRTELFVGFLLLVWRMI